MRSSFEGIGSVIPGEYNVRDGGHDAGRENPSAQATSPRSLTLPALEYLGRGLAQVRHEAELLEPAQEVVGDVDLPPEEALAGGSHEAVVVVVPPLPQGAPGE